MNNKLMDILDVIKYIVVSMVLFFVMIGISLYFWISFGSTLEQRYKNTDWSAYYAVKEDYYHNFKPSGEAEDTWYKYDIKSDNWFQIEDDDLPYQLAIRDMKSDHWYSNTWSEGSPFSDFRESKSFEEYLDSKVA